MNEPEKTFQEDESLPWSLWGNQTLLFLFHDAWFRVAALTFVLLVVGLGLFLPKIWRTSPDGFTPIVRVSGLDFVQAWQLRRAAIEHDRSGEIAEAVYSWRSAILNSPCDLELHRGLLRTLLGQQQPNREHLSFGVRDSFWLLRLARTNLAELDLVTAVYEKYGLDDLVQTGLSAYVDELTPTMAARLLKACFHRTEMVEFGTLWKRFGPVLKEDRDMQTYLAAWRSGWGMPGEIEEGRQALRAALGDPARRILAHQLRLSVSFAHGDLGEYEESLQVVRENHVDRVINTVNYWRLLAQSGRREDAIREARTYSTPPTTPAEAMGMASAFNLLGLDEYAAEFLEKHLPSFPWLAELWNFQANLLIAQKRWDDLRALAVGIRSDPVSRELLGGYSYYLEGLAHQGLHRADLAVDSFSKAPGLAFDTPLRALHTAKALNRLGQYEPAAELLRKWEGGLTNQAEFYNQVVIAGFGTHQSQGLLAAAERAYALEPDNLHYANNYAATLLMLRQRPSKALEITLKLLAVNPENPGALINHALALNQNLRFGDAAELLQKVDASDLTPEAATSYELAWFEIHAREGRPDRARAARERIQSQYLMPEQAKWLDETASTLRARGG